ncbi:uncharacterized protein LOC131948775 [Physella acuta]|uniref:uncharacterized protein LOC131948775 n=1 Tax=Physella acuta TaxID=109671 RepID=UPI0027DE00C3|nr:uncharacterized protein LOC131948775 [Physella acuta]
MCCAFNDSQMSALMALSMRRNNTLEAPLPEFNVSKFQFSPVSAHRALCPPINAFLTEPNENRAPQFESGKNIVVRFEHANCIPSPQTEHVRGVEVLTYGLRIQQPGMYYVYSNIRFRPESNQPCKEFKFQTWGHYVHKTRVNDPAHTGRLLQTTYTCCDECAAQDETSYLGGVFHFLDGDVISIHVSGHGLVSYENKTSFAGLLMLGSPDSTAD